VPYFRDEAEVYACIGRLFQSIVEDEELVARFLRANTVMQYCYSDPEAQITLKLIDGEDPRVDLGPTELEPEVIMTMDADVAHRFWLGEVNVTVALARGQMRAHGPVAKILRLVPLVKPVFPRYRAMLEQAGREDLLTAPGVLSLGR
jgi:putative sterol carrier protein